MRGHGSSKDRGHQAPPVNAPSITRPAAATTPPPDAYVTDKLAHVYDKGAKIDVTSKHDVPGDRAVTVEVTAPIDPSHPGSAVYLGWALQVRRALVQRGWPRIALRR
jgi:hypothetical protein